MIIKVEMTNWRAYEHQVFTFEPGLNFILGSNGKGKTSILEAISYGLTGESSIVENRDHLLRNPDEPAEVKVVFCVDETFYRVERTQNPGRAGKASLYDESNNKRIAYYQGKVTNKIEEIIGVSADFLKRIVYMAEGDVFRFLQNPPGKAMNQQIQMVLGITQLDQFQQAIKSSQKELRNLSKRLNVLQNRIRELGLTGKHLQSEIEKLRSRRENQQQQLLEVRDELSRREEQKSSIFELGSYIKNQLKNLMENEGYWNELKVRPLVTYFDQLQGFAIKQGEEVSKIEKNLARLGVQKDTLNELIEIIGNTISVPGNVLCPVCSKQMNKNEQERIIDEKIKILEKLTDEIETLERINYIEFNELQKINTIIDSLREIRNSIVHTRLPDIHPNMSLTEIMMVIEKDKQDPRKKELTERLSNLIAEQAMIDEEYAEYISIKNQLKQDGFDTTHDVQKKIVKIESRQFTLKAASRSAQQTLADLRNVGLENIYNQITGIWNHFIGRGDWSLQFDTDGAPILSKETERDYNFGQFSGGEKTALLVMIHTVIAHHFSKCQFLLIDEPLEHLDSVNRRSLMRFFIGAGANNLYSQALITTYEESLIRKYIGKEQVNTIYL